MSRTFDLPVLDRVRVASPCPVRWDDMKGDDRVRHCDHCKLNVFNLSDMTRQEAEELVTQRQGRLCAGFWRRADGTIITRDCPVGLAALRAKAAKALARVAAALGLLVTGAAMLGARRENQARLRDSEPFATLVGWLDPASQMRRGQTFMMGEICVPPPPVAPAAPSPTAR